MKIRVLLLLLFVMASPETARAYHGGPEYVEVLGWDPVDRKVFCAIHSLNEAAYTPGLVYFSLDSLGQAHPTRVPWSRESEPRGRDGQLRWDRLVKRLRPLELVEGPAIPRGNRVVAQDSVGTEYGFGPRYRVRVGSARNVGTPDLEVVTYMEPSIYFHRVYTIPGRPERLIILCFIGQTYGGEEVQVPILLRGKDAPPVRVEWMLWEP